MTRFTASNSLKKVLEGRNLYLVGMMGSGKTRTGDPLALQLGYSFVDMDAVIEQLIGQSIENFFQKEGENQFRLIESKVLQEVGQRHSLVVATGGGVVTKIENWGILHQGIVIWLDPGRDRLMSRLSSDYVKRPLLKDNNSLDNILAKRLSLYQEADLHVVVEDESPLEVAKNILKLLPSILIPLQKD